MAVGGFVVIRNIVGRFSPRNYDRAVALGRQEIPVAKDFDRLFPETEHFISYHSGTHGDPTWNAKAAIHGRYILTAQFKVRIRRWDGEIVAWSPPRFWLTEVESIHGPAGGPVNIRYDSEITFGPQEWQSVLENGGDLSVVGKVLKKAHPVPRFETIWRSGG
jgi:hypothetical protein